MSAFSVPERWEDAAEGVVPLLRTSTTPLDALRTGRHLVSRPVGAHLHARLAWEDERVRLFVTEAHLRRWGVSPDAAFARAFAGVEPTDGLAKNDHGVWEVRSRDGNGSARALLPGFLDAFRTRVTGPLLVGVPHARALYVCGADEAAAVAWLVGHLARAWTSEGDPIAPALLVWADGRLAPWAPASPDLQRAQHVAGLAFARREYERLAEVDDDVACADFEIAVYAGEGDAPGAPFSFARLGAGGDLPEVEVVVLEDPRVGPFLAVPFDALRIALGPRLQALPGAWPRFRVPPLEPDDMTRLSASAIPAERFGG